MTAEGSMAAKAHMLGGSGGMPPQYIVYILMHFCLENMLVQLSNLQYFYAVSVKNLLLSLL